MCNNGVRHPNTLKLKAKALRRSGWSIGRLALDLGISKGTASLWVADELLDNNARQELSRHHRLRMAATSQAHSQKAKARIDQAIFQANQQWQVSKGNAFFTWGIGFYMGDGERRTAQLGITNADHGVVDLWLFWCRTFLGDVPLKARIKVHSSAQKESARKHWHSVFSRHQVRLAGIDAYVSSATGRKRAVKRLPHGTVSIRQGLGSRCNHAKMMEWIRLTSDPEWRNWLA